MNKVTGVFSLIAILLTLFFASACSNTFVVTKDGESYFFGSGNEGIYKMLCESGDLRAILADTQLPSNIKDDLYKYNCGAERSKQKVGEIYTSLPPEQRRDLRLVFQKHGYDINYVVC